MEKKLCPKCLATSQCRRLNRHNGILFCTAHGCYWFGSHDQWKEAMRETIYAACRRSHLPCPDSMRPAWARSTPQIKEVLQ
ncbi:hypothetical protein [Desulfobaculum sp.]